MTNQTKCDLCESPATSHVAAILHDTKFDVYFCDAHRQSDGRELLSTLDNIFALEKPALDSSELIDLERKFDQLLLAHVRSRLPYKLPEK